MYVKEVHTSGPLQGQRKLLLDIATIQKLEQPVATHRTRSLARASSISANHNEQHIRGYAKRSQSTLAAPITGASSTGNSVAVGPSDTANRGTMMKRQSLLLTEGLTLKEQNLESLRAGNGQEEKRIRESGFPLGLLEKGFEINIAEGNASNESDKHHILNFIAGEEISDLDKPPKKTHEEYDKVNYTLRSLFAEAALNRVLQAYQHKANHKELSEHELQSLEKLFPALGGDATKKSLRVVLRDSAVTDDCIDELANESIAKLVALEYLYIELYCCKLLSDVSQLWISIGGLRDLQYLHLDMTGCKMLTDVSGLGQSLTKLKRLRELYMNFSHCERLEGVCVLGSSLKALKKLDKFTVDLHGCKTLPEALRNRTFTNVTGFINTTSFASASFTTSSADANRADDRHAHSVKKKNKNGGCTCLLQ